MTQLIVDSLTCEYRKNPLGIDVKKPRISWKVKSNLRGTIQNAYQIQVASNESFTDILWDTKIVESDDSIHIEYEGPDVKPRTRYFYRVKIWDNYDRESPWSKVAWWETGLIYTSEWKANWITPSPEEIDPHSEPAFLIRKKFALRKGIVSARLYGTGVGLYEVFLNGARVGDDLFNPGWTSYHKRLQYQTYDVTEQLVEGQNALGIVLADGWYKGTLSFENKRHVYGDKRAAIFQLYVKYQDGTEELITTDPTWKASTGPILYSEIYNGEIYDARLEVEDWCLPSIDEQNWKLTSKVNLPIENLVAQENWPTRVTEVIKPVNTFVTPNGETVIDMGQNMVGRIRFKVNAPKGTRICLKHGEVLDKEGNIYFGNLGKAEQKVEYITKGVAEEEYAPHFTYHGFRYVRVEGYPGQENGLPLDNFAGEVIHSDMEPTGEFECSQPLINQLQKNIVWGQRGNFLDLPTDCPQRNERLGWTGDAQVFIETAVFNYHCGPFFTKWLRDLKADQLEDGNVPIVIPAVVAGVGSAAWGDAATIVPWTLYQIYGDKRLLSEQYESMKAWVEFIRRQGKSEYLWNSGFHFGDWLALDAKENSFVGATPKDFIATVFYAYSTSIVRDTAKILGKFTDVQEYSLLLDKIIEHFNQEFVTPSGRLVSPTQTAHVIALMFDVVKGEAKERTAFELNELIIQNDYHLTTGFVGTPYLCLALSKGGYHETAVKLLMQESYPSWLYAIKKGATTIWEHWDSIKEDGSFWSDQMNSFNHYAYGSIGNWLYKNVAGIDMDNSAPAYKRIRIEPKFAGIELTYAKASYNTMYGKILSSWTLTDEEVKIDLEIPPNTTAEVFLPYATVSDVLESENLLINAIDIGSYFEKEDGVHLTIGSGVYCFKYRNKHGLKQTFSEETRVIDLLNQKETLEVIERYAPGISKPPAIFALKTEKLKDLPKHPESNLTNGMVKELIEDLNKINW